MKKLSIISLFLIITQISFGQREVILKVPGVSTAQLDAKLNITDTANRWVNTLANNATGDSLIYWIGSIRKAIPIPLDTTNLDKYLYFDSSAKTLHVKVSNDPNAIGDSSKLITDWAAKNITKNKIFINVKDYGAIGDSATDNTIAIRNALNAVPQGGATIFFPAGVYLVSDSILITKKIKILGEGAQSKNLQNTAISESYGSLIMQTTNNKNLFVVNTSGVTFDNVGLKNLNASPMGGAGIKFINGMQFLLNRVSVNNFYVNVDIINGWYWGIDHSYFQDAVTYNLQIRDTLFPDGGDASISSSYFNVGRYQSSTNIRQWSGGGLKISTCKFQRTNGASFIPYRMIDCSMDEGTSILLINNSSFEDFTGGAIVVANAAGKTFGHVLISNNQFSAVNSNQQHIIDVQALSQGEITNVSVSNNSIYPGNTSVAAIYIKNVIRGNISGNMYSDIPSGEYGYMITMDSVVNCVYFKHYVSGALNVYNKKIDDVAASVYGTDGQTADLQRWYVGAALKAYLTKDGFLSVATPAFTDSSNNAINTAFLYRGLRMTSNDVTLYANELPVFRGVRASTAWADGVDAQWFQVGNSYENIAFTARNGTIARRMAFLSDNVQFSPVIGIPAPTDNYELFSTTKVKIFSVSDNGNVKVPIMPTGINTDPMVVAGSDGTLKKVARAFGTATFSAGTITVSSTAVASTSKIFVTVNTPGGTQGFLSVPIASIIAGTSFVINSSSATDTSTVNWIIVN